jgi:ATP-binding cassette subfamily B protein
METEHGSASFDPRSIFDILHPSPDSSRLRRLPVLLWRVVALVWVAARREFLWAALLQLVGGAGVAAQLFVVRAALSAISGGGPRALGNAIMPLALLTALMVVLEFGRAFEAEQARVLGELVGRHALGRVLDSVTRAELVDFEDATFYDSVRRAQIQGTFRASQAAQGVIGLIGAVLTAAAIIASLASMQPYLLPVVLVGYLPLWFTARLDGRDSYSVAWGMTANDRHRVYLEGVMLERQPAKEIRAFQAGPFLRERYDSLYRERISEVRALAHRRIRRGTISATVSSAVTALALASLAWLVATQRLAVSSAGAALLALLQLSARLRALHMNAASLYESTLFMQDYSRLVDRQARHPRPARAAPVGIRHLAADSVSFWYPGAQAPAIKGVSLEIRAGEIVAVVGANGSGKTTLAKLLGGLYPPTEGRVLWDGVDVQSIDVEDLRRHLAFAFQDFERYLLSAYDNIALGRHERADAREAVIHAALEADADGFLRSLPQTYATQLGREFYGGYDLSVGQWQRIALARTFFRDAPFLILDEPTASLDPRAESELFDRLRTLLAKRSALLISHRFSSVRSADRIYVLVNGEVVEDGTHKTLLAARGTYFELFSLQAAHYQPDPELADSGYGPRPFKMDGSLRR